MIECWWAMLHVQDLLCLFISIYFNLYDNYLTQIASIPEATELLSGFINIPVWSFIFRHKSVPNTRCDQVCFNCLISLGFVVFINSQFQSFSHLYQLYFSLPDVHLEFMWYLPKSFYPANLFSIYCPFIFPTFVKWFWTH